MSADVSKRHAVRRLTAKYSRWLHIYGSMISFGVVFFFAVTGITLNHPQWFANAQRTITVKGAIDKTWLGPEGGTDDTTVNKLAIVEFFRSTHHVSGAVSDFRADDRECDVTFKGPGYSADIFVDRATGRFELTENRMGLGAVMNDLHKGRDSGAAWKWVIDISAGLLVFVSLTGLLLLWFVYKHRSAGFLSAAAGIMLVYVIYKVLVP